MHPQGLFTFMRDCSFSVTVSMSLLTECSFSVTVHCLWLSITPLWLCPLHHSPTVHLLWTCPWYCSVTVFVTPLTNCSFSVTMSMILLCDCVCDTAHTVHFLDCVQDNAHWLHFLWPYPWHHSWTVSMTPLTECSFSVTVHDTTHWMLIFCECPWHHSLNAHFMWLCPWIHWNR